MKIEQWAKTVTEEFDKMETDEKGDSTGDAIIACLQKLVEINKNDPIEK